MKTKEKEYSEIIQLLIWAYKQGYMHATEVLKETVPDDKQLSKMFKNAMEQQKGKPKEKI